MREAIRNWNPFVVVGAIAWLAVPALWSVAIVLDRTRAWEGAPTQAWILGVVALLAAGMLTLLAVLRVIRGDRRSRMLRAGIGIYGLGLLVTVVAGWAIPLWTTLFGVAMLIFARADVRLRRPGTFIGGAMLAATASMIILTLLEVGTPDSYGDYPIAWTSTIFIATIGAAAGMFLLSQRDSTVITESVGAVV